ncbi:1018_t:CDS:2, partial [Gigaspora rosea]
QYYKAFLDLNKALDINSLDMVTLLYRGKAYFNHSHYNKALFSDLEKKLNKEEVPPRNVIKQQVLESSNKENSRLASYTYRSSGSSINNETNYYQLSASTTKVGTNTRKSSISRGPSQKRFNKHHLEKESQADILKEILGRLTAIEEKYKIN